MQPSQISTAPLSSVADVYRILPEVVLTLTGVLVMLIDASLPKQNNRKPLGWLAVIGVLLALWASLWQLRLAPGSGYSGTVQTDTFSVFFHVLICGIVLAALLIAIDSIPSATENLGEYFALVIFGAVGMVLMSSAVELLLVFVSLEISSISTYVLAGFRKHAAKSPEAAIKYFLLGSFATAFFLYGVALIFGSTGTTRIPDIASLLAVSATPKLALVALAMLIIGLGFKVSAAPFHVWTPDVYEGAPSAVVALMSTAPKAAAFAVLLRVAYGIFPALHANWTALLWIIAVASMTLGNLAALRQQSLKRMLAYSSIAHAGYLLVAFSAFNLEGISAATFYIAGYAAMNVGIFAIVSHVSGYGEKMSLIQDYRGLAYRAPVLTAVMSFFLISLIGIPFTAGFFGKFYVFSAALNAGAYWLAIIGLLNSGIAAFYYLRVVTTAYTKAEEGASVAALPRFSIALTLALVLTLGATLILGIVPNGVLGMAQQGAADFDRARALPDDPDARPVVSSYEK